MIKKINIERLLDQFPGMTYKFRLYTDGSYSFPIISYSNFTDITEQKKNEKILEELNRSAVVLQKLNNEKEICQKTIEIADEILNFDASFLYLEKNNQFISFANSEARNEIMPLDYGLMGKAYRQNDNYLNPNLEKDSHARPTKSKYKSGITVSMKNLGVFQAVSTEINGFKEKDLKLAEILIANTQAALERLKLQKEIKANNLLFQSTLESIQDGISVISPDFTILYTNSKMNQWHAKNMPLKGQKCYKAYNNLNEICPDCPSARSLKTGKVEKKIDQREKALGAEFTEIYSYPMIDEEGRVHGVVKFIRDISERKKKEMELKKTKNHLNKEINKARRIHERTLPNEIPDINNLKISAYYKPANRLGGDFYNLKKLDDNKLLFYIIDITGHGLDSAMMSSFVKSTINSYLNLSSPEKN